MSDTLHMGVDVPMKPIEPVRMVGQELFATHEGVWHFGGHEIRCYRLSDGQTVFHADDVEKFFEFLSAAKGGSNG